MKVQISFSGIFVWTIFMLAEQPDSYTLVHAQANKQPGPIKSSEVLYEYLGTIASGVRVIARGHIFKK